MTAIPDGFDEMKTGSPFNTWAGPFYAKEVDANVIIGFIVAEHHCNSAGRVHGAMICAAADIALGRNIGIATHAKGYFDEGSLQNRSGAPIATMNLTTDFVGTARQGAWVEVHVDVQKAGRSVGFANAYLVSDGERIARASAVFKVL
ncbi:MAG: hypothetical protein GKR90_00225 [Pseudomonadales bacterium]|nr:hypothetical protein [Pseudomonadales bacterium]